MCVCLPLCLSACVSEVTSRNASSMTEGPSHMTATFNGADNCAGDIFREDRHCGEVHCTGKFMTGDHYLPLSQQEGSQILPSSKWHWCSRGLFHKTCLLLGCMFEPLYSLCLPGTPIVNHWKETQHSDLCTALPCCHEKCMHKVVTLLSQGITNVVKECSALGVNPL